jgi:hypothetical protein
MNILSRLVIAYLIFKVFKYMFGLFDTPSKKNITEPRKYEIEYYSEGKLLPNSFHKEYRMISNTVANSWIYEEQWQDLVNENHDAPIVEIDVKLPLQYRHSYTFKHVFLANSYLQDQKSYIEFLN